MTSASKSDDPPLTIKTVLVATLLGAAGSGIALAIVSAGYPWFLLPDKLRNYSGSAPPLEAEKEWARLVVFNDMAAFAVLGACIASLIGLVVISRGVSFKHRIGSGLIGAASGLLLGAAGAWLGHQSRGAMIDESGQASFLLPIALHFFAMLGPVLAIALTLGVRQTGQCSLAKWAVAAVVSAIATGTVYSFGAGILLPDLNTESVFSADLRDQWPPFLTIGLVATLVESLVIFRSGSASHSRVTGGTSSPESTTMATPQ